MKTVPAVFAVHSTYHIMVPTSAPSLMWVRVGEKNYYDECNGILRSDGGIHRMIVPAKELEKAGGYTICEREIIQRKAYFSDTEEVKETVFAFRPVKSGAVRCFHVADAHNRIAEPIRAAANYVAARGPIDFLIMNGDVVEDSGKIEHFDTIYEVAAGITKGEIPIVFARGNHDLRGVFAERIADYCPNENGQTYFTFRVGNIWGIALDCGEDKEDWHAEYGNTVCCHVFRERQTEFIRQVIEQKEYLAEGIEKRIVVVHNPFTQQLEEPFNIEEEIYREWAALLKEHIKPDVMICGHLHQLAVNLPGCDKDHLGQPCPVIVASNVGKGYYAGGGIAFEDKQVKVTFIDSDNQILGEESIALQ